MSSSVLASILIITIIVVICKSCSDGKENLAVLQRVWHYNQYTEYEFDGRGSGCMCIEETNHYEFTYTIDGDTLKIDYALDYVTDCEYDFKLENNNLTLIGGKGTANPSQEYTLERDTLKKGVFMKKFTLFVTLTLCILLLVGCGKQPQKPTGGTEPPTSSTQSENIELASLRSSIAEKKYMLGVGFLGYVDSECDEKAVQQFVNDSALASEYPFLKELNEVVLDGSELYAFVPTGKDAVITIYYAEISEDGNYIDHKDVPLFIGDAGEAIVVRCNLSEIHSNMLISVKDGANMLEFHPMLSMKDGHVATESGCYDFTNYEMTEEERAKNASELLTATDEVKDALERGMKLLYTGDTQVINGQQCLLFAIGTEHDDQFVREQLYAVSDDQVYTFYTDANEWKVLGAD